MVSFGFAVFVFPLRGASTIAPPPCPRSSGGHRAVLFFAPRDWSPSERQWPEHRGRKTSRALVLVAGLHTWTGLLAHRVELSEQVWPPCPQIQVSTWRARKSHASPPEHLGLGTPQPRSDLRQPDGGTLSTFLSQLPLLSPVAGALCTLGCSACPSSATM